MRRFFWVLTAVCVSGLAAGCISRQEGCLDPGAANYDLEADLACDMCCTYPGVDLIWSPKWADRNFALTDTFYDALGRPYLIRDFQFLLEGWRWADAGGRVYTVDSSSVTCGADILRWTRDFALVSPTQFNYRLGTIRTFPAVDSLSFSFGPLQDYQCLDPDAATTPIFLTPEGPLWDPANQRLSTWRLVWQADPALPDTDTLYAFQPESVALPYALTFDRGMAAQFQLTADYALWFSDALRDDPASFLVSWSTYLAGSVNRTP